MTKRIAALVFAAAVTVGLAAAPAQAKAQPLSKPIVTQASVSGWEWGSTKTAAGQSVTSGWEWGSVR